MIHRKCCFHWMGLGSLGLVALLAVWALADDPPKPRAGLGRADVGKTVHIEPPVEKVLVKSADITKKVVVEPATEKVLAGKSAAVTDASNPKVQPGKVRWHTTLAEACTASQKSGKPVLLFQMMGKLDHQFC